MQLAASGACGNAPKIQLSLAAGKVRNDADRAAIHAYFEEQGWELWDEAWLRDRLRHMSQQGYENQVSAVVSKLLLRGKID